MASLYEIRKDSGNGATERTIVGAIFALSTLIASLAGGTPMTQAAEPARPVAIAIHGGAGTIERRALTAEREKQIRDALEQAVRAGHNVLAAGGSSLKAVTAALVILEDSPYFNAGRGAVLNEDGEVELDAAVMNGADLAAGAVAAVRGVKNPILLARAVLDHSPHVLLGGRGAEQFGREQHIEFMPADYFKTEFRLEQWRRRKDNPQAAQGMVVDDTARWYSTVGAVALDRGGQLAAATSTGGLTMKRWGRIGDSPLIGAGTYADSRYCAVSGTGHGEYFIRVAVAHDICARVRDRGISVSTAAHQVVFDVLKPMGGDGGVIALGPHGEIAMPFNTPGMYRAAIHPDGRLEVAIFAGE